jgi:plastocyanin
MEITMAKRLLLVCSCVLALALASCGGGGDNTPALPPAASGPAGGGNAAPAATASISGKILFDGAAPAMTKINMTADQYCESHSKNPMTEDVVVSDGGLENVIVYVSGGLEGKTFPVPTDPVMIDQHDCHYVPHVFTIQVGQKLQIKNSDSTLHNIHMFSEKNAAFNTGQPVQGEVTDHVFDKPEMPLPVRCDVHKWMSAFIGVFDNPYNTVSKTGGAYEIKLAPGKYEITAWHEKYGTQKQNIEVKDGDHPTLNFTFKPTATTD